MKPLAITHNSNASKTVIFGSNNDSDGKPYDRDYALRRAHFEPLIEMMQIKGNSEVHRQFWQTDEFSNLEHAGSLAKFSDRTIDQRNFVRWSVIGGLAWEQKLGVNGKLTAVGNTVDLATARYRNSIGAVDLIGSWVDDDFDPAVPALYYARLLEIPTPRWTTFEAVINGMPLLDEVPATIQERAWTSPIWFSPISHLEAQ